MLRPTAQTKTGPIPQILAEMGFDRAALQNSRLLLGLAKPSQPFIQSVRAPQTREESFSETRRLVLAQTPGSKRPCQLQHSAKVQEARDEKK